MRQIIKKLSLMLGKNHYVRIFIVISLFCNLYLVFKFLNIEKDFCGDYYKDDPRVIAREFAMKFIIVLNFNSIIFFRKIKLLKIIWVLMLLLSLFFIASQEMTTCMGPLIAN